MFKKLLGLFAAICILFTAVPSVFAMDEVGEIEAAQKAIKQKKDTLMLVNEMTPDSFLYDIKLILPEGSTVELSFSKESDYRRIDATSEKDGSIFANICFTCGPYVRHEMYDFVIPKLTGAAAEANADKEKLAEDIVPDKDEHGLNKPRHIHIHAQHCAQKLRDGPVHAKRGEAGGDEAAGLGKDVGVLALKDEAAVRGIGEGHAGDPVHNGQHGVLREAGMGSAAEEQEVEAEARQRRDKRRQTADDEVNYEFPVFYEQRLYLINHSSFLPLPLCRRCGR